MNKPAFLLLIPLLFLPACAARDAAGNFTEPPKIGDKIVQGVEDFFDGAFDAAKEALPGVVKSLSEDPSPANAGAQGLSLLWKAVIAGATAVGAGGAGSVYVRRKRRSKKAKDAAPAPPVPEPKP